MDIVRDISCAVILVREFYSFLDTDMGYVKNLTESQVFSLSTFSCSISPVVRSPPRLRVALCSDQASDTRGLQSNATLSVSFFHS